MTDPLAQLPRLRLAHLPTPLEPMDGLAKELGRAPGTLWVKRDDCTGLAAGGNKARKLEFALAEPAAAGADTLVTLGGPQSNAARMTAAAARRLGMNCTLILEGSRPAELTGNIVLDSLLGAELVWLTSDLPADEAIALECERLTAQGRRPAGIAVGASTPTGSLGYVGAALEIIGQLPQVDVVVTATGSAGTQAGLVAGFGDHAKVLGVRVGERRYLRERVQAMAAATAALAGLAEPAGQCWLEEGYLGDGYGAHTGSCAEAMVLAARTEGLLLDPVYTGKSMAGLIGACRAGVIPPDAVVVWVHTGGLPGLLSADHGPWAVAEAAKDWTERRW